MQTRNRVDRTSTRFANENVFSERNRRSKSLIRFYRAKTSLAQAKTRLRAKNALTERKRQTQMRKRVFRAEMSLSKHIFAFARKVFARLWSFRSINAFSPLQTLFSLGKSLFAFAIDVFARYSVIALRATFSLGFFAFQSNVFARGTCFRSINAFSLGKRFFALFASFSLGKKRFRLSGARFRLVNVFSPLRGTY